MIIDVSASCINNNDFWKQKGGRTFASLLLALDCDSGADEVKTAVCRVVLHAAGLEWTYCLNGKPCDLLTTPIHASKQESGFIPTQCLLSFCYNGLSDGFFEKGDSLEVTVKVAASMSVQSCLLKFDGCSWSTGRLHFD